MTWAIYLTLWVSSMALAASIGACVVASRSLRQCRLTSSAVLSGRLTELEQTVESISGSVRGIRSRLNVQAYRQRQRDQAQPPESTEPIDPERAAAETRAELNARLARGELKGTT